MLKKQCARWAAATVLLWAFGVAAAPGGGALLREYETAARAETPAFGGFSAARGQAFFTTLRASEWSCASCHTERPSQPGKHARTGKSIAPLAPVANQERFTDPAKVEKWFRRNCNDVVQRACTSVEKGDVITWLLSIGS